MSGIKIEVSEKIAELLIEKLDKKSKSRKPKVNKCCTNSGDDFGFLFDFFVLVANESLKSSSSSETVCGVKSETGSSDKKSETVCGVKSETSSLDKKSETSSGVKSETSSSDKNSEFISNILSYIAGTPIKFTYSTNCGKSVSEKQADDKSEKQADDKSDDKAEKQAEDKSEKQAEDKSEKQAEDKSEKQDEKQAEKQAEDKSEKQAEDKSEKQLENDINNVVDTIMETFSQNGITKQMIGDTFETFVNNIVDISNK